MCHNYGENIRNNKTFLTSFSAAFEIWAFGGIFFYYSIQKL